MAEVIDFNKKLTEYKAGKTQRDFLARKQKCIQNRSKDGVCNCNHCKIIRSVAAEVAEFGYNKSLDYSKKFKEKLCWGDIFEALQLATLVIKEYTKPDKTPPDKK